MTNGAPHRIAALLHRLVSGPRGIGIDLAESLRIALAQIRAYKMRSILTTLGVIIGIVAVTLMGSAIRGIETGFERSLAVIGDDVFYVEKWPWERVEDWWNYRNRRRMDVRYADQLNQIIAATPDSELVLAVPTMNTVKSVKYGAIEVRGVFTQGTTHAFLETSHVTFREGRYMTPMESRAGRNVCVLGSEVADALFPSGLPINKRVLIGGKPFVVVGVFDKQGTFLGLFSFDNQVVVPLQAFMKAFGARLDTSIRVKMKDRSRTAKARDELIGAMRRVRGLDPEDENDFSVNEQGALRSTIGPIKAGIFGAGLFVTSLALFVGAIGIMNITFVSVKERTREIGTRKALGARRKTILLQFLIEAICVCLVGGAVGVGVSWGLCTAVANANPSFPIQFSLDLVLVGMIVSITTGIFSGFAPAYTASRLDPIEALRYE